MKKENLLIKAIKGHNLTQIKEALTDSSVNIYEENKSALMVAIEYDNLEAMMLLLNSKTLKVNSQNNKGMSALHLATQKNNPIMVAMLLLKKADYYITNHNNETAFNCLSKANKGSIKLITDLFYQSGFRQDGINEEAKKHYKKNSKITTNNNEVFINNAVKMFTLYQTNKENYFNKRNELLSNTIVKYLKITDNQQHVTEILKYIKPKLNIYETNQHLLISLIQNTKYDIVKAINDSGYIFDFTVTNQYHENIMHNLCNISHMFNLPIEKKEFNEYIINNIKKYSLLEKEDKNGLIPLFNLKNYSSQSMFDLLSEIIIQEKIFDINKKYNIDIKNNKKISFLEFLNEKMINSHSHYNMVSFYEKMISFNEKQRLENQVDEKIRLNKKVKI
jgi:hypothetical protein